MFHNYPAAQNQELVVDERDAGRRRSKGKATGASAKMQINCRITSAAQSGDLAFVLRTIGAHLDEMNDINLATSMHRLGKMTTRKDTRNSLDVQSSPVFVKLYSIIFERIMSPGGEASAMPVHCMAVIVWGLAVMKHPAPELFRAVAELAVTRIDDFQAFEFCQLLWAFAKSGIEAYALFRAAARRLKSRRDGDMKGLCLSMLAWSFSMAGVRDPELFTGFAKELPKYVLELKPQEIANCLKAFANVDVYDEAFFMCFATDVAVGGRMVGFKAQELIDVIRSVVKAGHHDPVLFEHLGPVVIQKRWQMSPDSLATALHAFVLVSQPRRERQLSVVLALQEGLLGKNWTATPQEVVTMLHGLMQMAERATHHLTSILQCCEVTVVEAALRGVSNQALLTLCSICFAHQALSASEWVLNLVCSEGVSRCDTSGDPALQFMAGRLSSLNFDSTFSPSTLSAVQNWRTNVCQALHLYGAGNLGRNSPIDAQAAKATPALPPFRHQHEGGHGSAATTASAASSVSSDVFEPISESFQFQHIVWTRDTLDFSDISPTSTLSQVMEEFGPMPWARGVRIFARFIRLADKRIAEMGPSVLQTLSLHNISLDASDAPQWTLTPSQSAIWWAPEEQLLGSLEGATPMQIWSVLSYKLGLLLRSLLLSGHADPHAPVDPVAAADVPDLVRHLVTACLRGEKAEAPNRTIVDLIVASLERQADFVDSRASQSTQQEESHQSSLEQLRARRRHLANQPMQQQPLQPAVPCCSSSVFWAQTSPASSFGPSPLSGPCGTAAAAAAAGQQVLCSDLPPQLPTPPLPTASALEHRHQQQQQQQQQHLRAQAASPPVRQFNHIFRVQQDREQHSF